MEKEKVNDDGQPDPENSLDISEHFNQLELLETHGHLIPTGTQSLWVGNSDEEEEQDEETEEWYQLQEKKMEKDPSKLLLWAAEKNRLSTVRRLLSEKATHVNTRDEDEYTPLHRAAYSGHLEVVRELIAQGADVHAVTMDGWTPLHSAWKKFLYCEPHKRIKEVLEEELYIKRDECHIKNPPAVALEGIWSIRRNFPVGGLKPGPPSRNTLLPQAKYYSRHGGLRR
uniref:Ankyrin repeat domain 49 n=1 Tax=Pipistrellus kuhlii TaxID=59472 RepID=A0A7J7X0F2_PIPKU|nr:hypothetical protein mPipKuh1_010792 [Pipistrellus kuhlii]